MQRWNGNRGLRVSKSRRPGRRASSLSPCSSHWWPGSTSRWRRKRSQRTELKRCSLAQRRMGAGGNNAMGTFESKADPCDYAGPALL
jgi:hypothetical protein